MDTHRAPIMASASRPGIMANTLVDVGQLRETVRGELEGLLQEWGGGHRLT